MPTHSYVPHAPGYVDNEGPKIVTSRFGYEDSFTLERYQATGGYQALRSPDSKSSLKMTSLAGTKTRLVVVISNSVDIPVLSQASSRLTPSKPRNGLKPSLARCRNWMYSQLVCWYINLSSSETAPDGMFTRISAW